MQLLYIQFEFMNYTSVLKIKIQFLPTNEAI